jgi:hypothetical protein
MRKGDRERVELWEGYCVHLLKWIGYQTQPYPHHEEAGQAKEPSELYGVSKVTCRVSTAHVTGSTVWSEEEPGGLYRVSTSRVHIE